MNRLTARRTAVAVTAGLALSFTAALPAQAADATVTEAQWLSDVAAVTGPAQTYIDGRVAANTSGAELAIVLVSARSNLFNPVTKSDLTSVGTRSTASTRGRSRSC